MKITVTKDAGGTTIVAAPETVTVLQAIRSPLIAGPCAETDPDLWFPERGNDAAADTARAICRTSCLSRTACLRFALTHYEEGIWGGFNEKGRDRARRQHRAGKPLEVIIAEDDARIRAKEEQARQLRLAAVARKRNAERARHAARRAAA